jgi:hypothetical protein
VPLGVYDHPAPEGVATSVPLGEVEGRPWWDLPTWEVRGLMKLTELRASFNARISNVLGDAG